MRKMGLEEVLIAERVQIPNMLSSRGSHACAVLGDKLYAIGGYAALKPLVCILFLDVCCFAKLHSFCVFISIEAVCLEMRCSTQRELRSCQLVPVVSIQSSLRSNTLVTAGTYNILPNS